MVTDLESKPLLRGRDILVLLGISKATLHRWRGAGRFPKPIRLGPRMLAWRRVDLEAWIDDLPVSQE